MLNFFCLLRFKIFSDAINPSITGMFKSIKMSSYPSHQNLWCCSKHLWIAFSPLSAVSDLMSILFKNSLRIIAFIGWSSTMRTGAQSHLFIKLRSNAFEFEALSRVWELTHQMRIISFSHHVAVVTSLALF